MVLEPFALSPTGRLDRHPSEACRTAWSLLEEQAPREALAVLAPAIEVEPESSALLTLRAWAYFQSAQLRLAEEDLRVLVDGDPTDVWSRFTLGRVLERQAKYAEALPHMRLAAVMSGDPEHEASLMRCERKAAGI